MSELHDGGQAFPTSPATVKEWDCGAETEVTYRGIEGMSLRDYFAAQCIASLRAIELPDDEVKRLANCAYRVADAMLAERDK